MKSKMLSLIFVLFAATALNCGCMHQAATPDSLPKWMSSTPRLVEGDRIYFLASAENKFLDRARLDAEGAALEDIASECSFVPTSVKRENESSSDQTKAATHTVKAQYSVTQADCLKAQSTFAPEEIRIFANLVATQKILKHQDSVGESSDPSGAAQDAVKEGDLSGLMNARQQIALQKQAVILSGQSHYRLHTPESKRFYQKIKADSDPIIALGKQAAAQSMTLSWSSTQQKDPEGIPVPVLSTDNAPAPTPTPIPTAPTGKRKGPKATPKSFPKN